MMGRSPKDEGVVTFLTKRHLDLICTFYAVYDCRLIHLAAGNAASAWRRLSKLELLTAWSTCILTSC